MYEGLYGSHAGLYVCRAFVCVTCCQFFSPSWCQGLDAVNDCGTHLYRIVCTALSKFITCMQTIQKCTQDPGRIVTKLLKSLI